MCAVSDSVFCLSVSFYVTRRIAARGGYPEAERALAFRARVGYAAAPQCEDAFAGYVQLAMDSIEQWEEGEGALPSYEIVRLGDGPEPLLEWGSVGARASHTHAEHAAVHRREANLVDYFQANARGGHARAAGEGADANNAQGAHEALGNTFLKVSTISTTVFPRVAADAFSRDSLDIAAHRASTARSPTRSRLCGTSSWRRMRATHAHRHSLAACTRPATA